MVITLVLRDNAFSPPMRCCSQEPACSFVVLQWKMPLPTPPHQNYKWSYIISIISPRFNFLYPIVKKTMKHLVVDYELPKSNTSLALLQYRQNNQTYVAPYLSHLQIRGSKSQTSMLKLYLILTTALCMNKVFCWRFFLNFTAFFLQWKFLKFQEATDCVYTHVRV